MRVIDQQTFVILVLSLYNKKPQMLTLIPPEKIVIHSLENIF